MRDLVKQIHVAGATLTPLETQHNLLHPIGAFTAGRALTAGLMLIKLRPAGDDAHNRDRLIEHLQRTRTQHRPGCAHGLIIQGSIQLILGENRGRRTAGGPELQLVARTDTARHLNELTHRDTEGSLELAWVFHVTRHRENAVTLRLLSAHRRIPLRRVTEDTRHLGDSLHVVNHRGTGVQAGNRGERGLQTRVASAPLKGIQQGRLFTADVGAGARVSGDTQVAEHASLTGLTHSLKQTAIHVRNLAAQVDERVVAANRTRRDRDTFNENMRVAHDERDVLAGARLGLVDPNPSRPR